MHQVGTELLTRSRAYRQFDQIFSCPLTVLRAPMGYGKTAAVREYVRDRGITPVWLPLLGTDISHICRWARLTAQVRKRNPALSDRLDRLGFPDDAPARARIAETICAAEFEAPTLVVVNDYHQADCRRVADFVALIAERSIKNLHLLLLARETPALPVGDLEQRGLCLLLGQEALQFRAENPLPGSGLPGAYSDGELSLLLRLCWLDFFTCEQAACVLGDPHAGERLASLCREDGLVAHNDALAAYELAGFFREFLREEATRRGVDPLPILRRMGLWLLARGERAEAYLYLCRAGDGEPLLADLDQPEAEGARYLQDPRLRALLSALPPEHGYRHPRSTLRLLRTAALAAPPTGRAETVRRLCDMEAHFLTADLPEAERARVLGGIHAVWAEASFHNVCEMAAHRARAVDYLGSSPGCAWPTFGAPHLLYCYHNVPGALRARVETIAASGTAEGCGAGPLALAEYALETGDLDRAELRAQEAFLLSRQRCRSDIAVCAAFVLARLRLCHGTFETGRRLLSELAEQIGREDPATLGTAAELCTAYIDSCYGRGAEMPRWLRENDMDGSFASYGTAFPYLVCLRAVLLSGAFVRLEVLCQEFRVRFDTYHNILGYIHCDICLAVARERLRGIEAGCETLEKALQLAAEDGVVMPFAESAAGILPMLRKMRGSKRVPQAFLERVTACCEIYHQSVSGRLPDAVTLTDREREILRLLALDLKHEAVAARLLISVPTVRYHVKNAYQKLEVNNRSAAVQKARTLKLLD